MEQWTVRLQNQFIIIIIRKLWGLLSGATHFTQVLFSFFAHKTTTKNAQGCQSVVRPIFVQHVRTLESTKQKTKNKKKQTTTTLSYTSSSGLSHDSARLLSLLGWPEALWNAKFLSNTFTHVRLSLGIQPQTF